MEMYIIDIEGEQECEDETSCMIAENIVLNRDIIRGYTTNRFIMIRYLEFMESIMGRFVKFITTSFEFDDNVSEDEYEEMALNHYKEVFKDYYNLNANSLQELTLTKLVNGGEVICTDEMIEFSVETWRDESILESIAFLFDPCINYIICMKESQTMIDFRQFILDGLLYRISDFYEENGKYSIDIYAVVRYYIVKLIFTGMEVI